MTEAQFRAFLRQARAELALDLAELDAIDTSDWSAEARAELEERRRGYLALREFMIDAASALEPDAAEQIVRNPISSVLSALRTLH